MKLYEFFSVPSIDKDNEHTSTYKNKSEKEKLANDVYWYILDHDRLHKTHFMPIAYEMYQHVKSKKSIDRKRYTECWMPMVKEGCSDFYKEKKMTGKLEKIFNNEFRETLCKRLAHRHIEDISKNLYKLGD